MSKRILIIASVIGVVFLFAGYNLYSYFQTQAVIAVEKERAAEERLVEREAKRAAEEARKAAELRQAEERAAAERAAIAERQEQQRLAAEAQRKAQREAQREAGEKATADREAERLAKRVERAREVEFIETFDEEALNRIRAMSPRYLRDNPAVATEIISIPPNSWVMGRTPRLMKDQSTGFMLLAAATRNTEVLKAALDAGADINAANVEGYTALMFAAAYNSAGIVSFLIERGADISAVATKWNLNALHIACVYNPHPDVVEALIKGGLDIESKISAGDTPLVIAAANTSNLEVVQRLVELGADKNVYSSENGRTPHGIVASRLSERDGRVRNISDEFNAEVLRMLD
jgi:hypothetical protein